MLGCDHIGNDDEDLDNVEQQRRPLDEEQSLEDAEDITKEEIENILRTIPFQDSKQVTDCQFSLEARS